MFPFNKGTSGGQGEEKDKDPAGGGSGSGGPKNRQLWVNLLSTLLIFLLLISAYSLFTELRNEPEEIPLSQLAKDITAGSVEAITVQGEDLEITYADDTVKESKKEADTALTETLRNYDIPVETLNAVEISVKNPGGFRFWFLNLAPFLLPLLLIGLFLWFITRQVRGAGMQAFSFGQSKARMIDPNDTTQKVTFKDVAGVKEAKEELTEIVEFLKHPKKFIDIGARIPKGIVLMGAPGTGKCVVGDTQLLTNKGLVRIDEVPKYFAVNEDNTVEGLEVTTLDPKTRELKHTRASHWYSLGEQETRRIVTDIGTPIEGTLEHPVVSVDADTGNFVFRRLDELAEDDWLVLGHNTHAYGTYTKVPNTDSAYLIGVLTGDGCLSVRNRVTLSTADREVLAKAERIAAKEFGVGFRKTKTRPYDYELSSISAKQQLRAWGMTESYAEGKQVPEWVRLAPREYIAAFLRGLFDTDGSVETNGAVCFSSSSQKLVEDVHLLLLNLGIVSRRYDRRKKYNNKYHAYLTIYGDFLEAFANEIGFTVTHKHTRLKKLVSRQRNTNVNIIPNQQQAIQAVWEKTMATTTVERTRAFYNQPLYKNVHRYIHGVRKPSHRGLNLFLDNVSGLAPAVSRMPEVAHLRGIADGRFFFTRVKEITRGTEPVYDLTVPHTHNFIANGFINHNTLLARAVAGEAGVPFFSISGSEFVEMFVGVGASRTRDLFRMAKKVAPSIIFIDEIDAVGRVRGTGVGGGNDEREQTLNQILVELDGFEPHEKVIVMAASVTGDTPVLVKQHGEHKLLPIADVVDPYYEDGEEGVEKFAGELYTLGLEKRENKRNYRATYFGGSGFKKVRGVFRHKVSEIYEVEYQGGVVRTTGNHSVFVNTQHGIVPKPVSDLRPGEFLVPLPEGDVQRFGFGKTWDPLGAREGKENTDRAKVTSVRRVPYDGYVYDFCGCENEAFFGGTAPVLLHNTNRPDVLDPALLRPGRFDRRVVIDLPDRSDRLEILKVHATKKPLEKEVNLETVAERTPGFSGADLYSLMNEAAILAARRNRKKINQDDLIKSIEKVMLGPERRSHLMTEEEKKITAYHEAGHALIASVLPYADPVHKISIISRGRTAGYTLKLPFEDRRMQSKREFIDDIAASLGGYVAEEEVFGNLTTGASNDLQVLTALARDMVTKYGMSEKVGPVALETMAGQPLYGQGQAGREYSEKVSADIDAEVKRIIDEAYRQAKTIVTKHRDALDAIAGKLMEVETLERPEFEAILRECGIEPKQKPADKKQNRLVE